MDEVSSSLGLVLGLKDESELLEELIVTPFE